jgi:hypothetical protein
MRLYGGELLATCPTPRLENHPLLAVCDFIQHIHSYPPYLEAFFSICNMRWFHALVIRDPLNIACMGDIRMCKYFWLNSPKGRHHLET